MVQYQAMTTAPLPKSAPESNIAMAESRSQEEIQDLVENLKAKFKYELKEKNAHDVLVQTKWEVWFPPREREAIQQLRYATRKIIRFDNNGIGILRTMLSEVFNDIQVNAGPGISELGLNDPSVSNLQRNLAVTRFEYQKNAKLALDNFQLEIARYEEAVLRAMWREGTLTEQVSWLADFDAFIEEAKKPVDLSEASAEPRTQAQA